MHGIWSSRIIKLKAFVTYWSSSLEFTVASGVQSGKKGAAIDSACCSESHEPEGGREYFVGPNELSALENLEWHRAS